MGSWVSRLNVAERHSEQSLFPNHESRGVGFLPSYGVVGAAAPAALVRQLPRLQFGSADVGTRQTFAGGAPAPLRSFARASPFNPFNFSTINQSVNDVLITRL